MTVHLRLEDLLAIDAASVEEHASTDRHRVAGDDAATVNDDVAVQHVRTSVEPAVHIERPFGYGNGAVKGPR